MMQEYFSMREAEQNYWEKIFIDWEKSGLSQKEYCKMNNISYSTFKAWRYKNKSASDNSPSATMLPLKVGPSNTNITQVCISLPSKANLSISSITTMELKSILLDLGLLA
jgi:transposase